jgi:ribosome biogenesis GTPase / thiamine phosphate phosphatase
MTNETDALADYGWSPFFQSQLDPNESKTLVPVRVMVVHRTRLDVAGPEFTGRIAGLDSGDEEGRATVGDWLLIDRVTRAPRRLLARKSLFKRKAAGTGRRVQLIAANVDTLFIVSSCNQDFNSARLERYLALAREAGVMPVVVLTKSDLADDPDTYATQAGKLMPGLLVESLDARSAAEVGRLRPWCGRGQTVALVGSSGVGKSTIVNTLAGTSIQSTAAIREDDAHGRHTTRGRSLHLLATGGWLLDTPGMRELQLTDVESGIEEVFADIIALADKCRFADCHHEAEPGCAIRAAIDEGRLDAERLKRFCKLAAEDARNSEAIHARKARERGFGKMMRSIQKDKKGRWDR